MNTYIRFFLLVFFCITIAGCQSRSTMLFIYKNYSYELLQSHPEMEKIIKKNCRKYGYEPQFVMMHKSEEQGFSSDSITKAAPAIVYIDSLMQESPGFVAASFPDILFFSLDRNIEGKYPPNLLLITFDRRDIFKEAGTRAGEFLLKLDSKETENPEKGVEAKTGMVIFHASGDIKREAAEFKRGFTEVCPDNRFIYREVNNITDKVMIKNILDEMKSKGVVIFFFRMYSSNIYCLDYAKKEGGYAIVENWELVSGYEDIILFSLKDDFPRSLVSVFKNIKTEKDRNNEWLEKKINGTIRILPGKAVLSD